MSCTTSNSDMSTLPVEFQKGKRFFCALPIKNRHNGCFLMACGNEKNVFKGYMALQARSGGGPCKTHRKILYAIKHADFDVNMDYESEAESRYSSN